VIDRPAELDLNRDESNVTDTLDDQMMAPITSPNARRRLKEKVANVRADWERASNIGDPSEKSLAY
jgi:hypothetical protein